MISALSKLTNWLQENPDYNLKQEKFVIEFDLIGFALLSQAFLDEQDDCFYLRDTADNIIFFDLEFAEKIIEDLGVEFLKKICD